MKRQGVVAVLILATLLLCDSLWAIPRTAHEAEMVVRGWLKGNPRPLETAIGQQVAKVETFTRDPAAEPAYYIVYLQPSGFVIVSADDLVEPIIGFADDGVYDPTPTNPLGTLVIEDLQERMAATQSSYGPLAAFPQATSETQEKWSYLISLAEGTEDGFEWTLKPPIRDNMSDLRVAPLIKSKWGQSYYLDDDGQRRACYNYYTPQFLNGRAIFVEDSKDNYPCGCVATAIGQLMRYHRYPTEPVELREFTIYVQGKPTKRSLLGGGGPGGAYLWDEMVFDPTVGVTDTQRRAIGALCHDAGVAVGMDYWPDGSGATVNSTAEALVETFHYDSAVWAEDTGNVTWSQDLTHMINSNLDANLPVFLGIRDSIRPWRGHAVLCDGYGYELSAAYHHLNMGWYGMEDCWYNLPNVDCPHPDIVGFDVITRCIYNIFPEGTGEIISGRIIDSDGKPMSNVAVTVQRKTGAETHTTATNGRGIYAFRGLAPDSTYIIRANKQGYDFELNKGYDSDPDAVQTGTSVYGRSGCGSKWGVNFVGYGNAGGNSQVVYGDVKLTASDGKPDNYFGCSVSISGDYAIVGANGNDNKRGAAYIFKREGPNWIQQAKLRAPIGHRKRDGYFGFSVSISGDYAIVGSFGTCSANIFKRDGESWACHTELGYSELEGFGRMVSIDGDYAIVGAPRTDSETVTYRWRQWGCAHIFMREDTGWTRKTKLWASDASEYQFFGEVVSITDNYAVAAKRRNNLYGPVYIFKRDGTNWSEQAILSSLEKSFGRSLSVSADFVIVGAPEENNDDRIASGSAHVFSRNGTTWTRQIKLTALDGESVDHFGNAVSISGDYILVGAPDDDDDYNGRDSGSAYIFKRDGGNWAQQARLTSLDGTYSDHFGYSVSIDGDYAIAGAPDDDDNGKDSGSAYIFKRIGSTWSP